MSYHVYADIVPSDISEKEMIELTDDAGDGEVDMAIYESHRASADAEINGILDAAGYVTPLSPVPELIKTLSKGMTIYRLYLRRWREKMPDSMERAESARGKLLAKIATGDIKFGSGEPAPNMAGVYKTNKTSKDRTFSKTTLDGF